MAGGCSPEAHGARRRAAVLVEQLENLTRAVRGARVAPRRDDERGRVDGCEQGLIVVWFNRVAVAVSAAGRVARSANRLTTCSDWKPHRSVNPTILRTVRSSTKASARLRQHHATVGHPDRPSGG